MADMYSGLVAFLYGWPAISTAVGGAVSAQNGGRRIFPNVMPQGLTKTSIVYSQVSDTGDHHMRGPAYLARPRVTIACYSTDPDVARALAKEVKKRIDSYRGAWPYGSNSPQDVVTVQGVFFDTQRDVPYDNGTKLYGVQQDYFIWHVDN